MPWDTGLTGPYLRIASYPGTPLRVMAGPGTGKTFALMRRVWRLLETGTAPSSILVVTFTRTAANDLIDHLSSLGCTGADQVTASTLHGLSFAILRNNAVFQVMHRVPRPLMKFEVDSLVSDLADDFGGKIPTRKLMSEFEAYWAVLQHHQPGWPSDPTQQAFERELINWLAYHKSMLLGELVPRALDYILQNPASLHVPRYAHTLVDEYQDLNKADQSLIDALAQNGTLTIVGDEDQSVYTNLRHAQPESINEFSLTHANTHDEPLNQCQRCPDLPIQMANALILHNHPGRPSTICSRPGCSVGDVYIVQHNSVEEEVTTTADFINWYLLQNPEVKPSEILVLSTRRFIGYAVKNKLISIGRNAQSFFTEECLDKYPARAGYCLLRLLVDPTDSSALRSWLGLGHPDYYSKEYKRVWNLAEANGETPKEVLDKIVAGSISAPAHTSNIIRRYIALNASITPLARASGISLIDSLWPAGDPDCAEIRSIALTIASSIFSPAGMLQALIENITQPELPGDQNDVIRIMSLHKSKGLTAKCVLVVGCVAGALPTIKANLSAMAVRRAEEEQRRLFYVAITRTKQTLVLSSATLVNYGVAKHEGLTITRRIGPDAELQASPFMRLLGGQAPRAVRGTQWRSSLGF